MQMIDKNKDGAIDYDEFLELMKERELSGSAAVAHQTKTMKLRNSVQGTARLARSLVFGRS
jgi:Ca2+-binding EF-hand superfamily protein